MPVPASAAYADLTELARGLEAGDWTSVELTRFSIDRCKSYGPKLNAVTAVLEIHLFGGCRASHAPG